MSPKQVTRSLTHKMPNYDEHREGGAALGPGRLPFSNQENRAASRAKLPGEVGLDREFQRYKFLRILL